MIRRLIPTPSQRSHRVPKYISASNRNYPQPLQPMAPSTTPPSFPFQLGREISHNWTRLTRNAIRFPGHHLRYIGRLRLHPRDPTVFPTIYRHQTTDLCSRMAPSGNLSSATYPQLPTPNATVAQSASSPSQVQGPRPNTNRPNYALTLCQCCSLLAGRPTGSICVGGQHAPALGRRYRVLSQHARGPLRMGHGCSGRPVHHLDAKGGLKV